MRFVFVDEINDYQPIWGNDQPREYQDSNGSIGLEEVKEPKYSKS